MIKIVESGNSHGTMNEDTIRLSNLTPEDIELIEQKYKKNIKQISAEELFSIRSELLKGHLNALAETMNFDKSKLFIGSGKNNTSPLEITDDYIAKHPEGCTSIDNNILIITKNIPGVVIGHVTSDEPVVMLNDLKKGITAIGLCSPELIYNNYVSKMANMLQEYGVKPEDIMTYVSASAREIEYKNIPLWVKNIENWQSITTSSESKERISEKRIFQLNKVILEQLIAIGIKPENILFNLTNTISNDSYYSEISFAQDFLRNDERYGRNFVGMFYDQTRDDKEEPKVLVKRGYDQEITFPISKK